MFTPSKLCMHIHIYAGTKQVGLDTSKFQVHVILRRAYTLIPSACQLTGLSDIQALGLNTFHWFSFPTNLMK